MRSASCRRHIVLGWEAAGIALTHTDKKRTIAKTSTLTSPAPAAKSTFFLKIWRRERDSNPRYPCGYSGFQDQPGHPSARRVYSDLRGRKLRRRSSDVSATCFSSRPCPRPWARSSGPFVFSVAMLGQGRTDRCSSRCPMRPRSHARTSLSHRRMHRLRRGHGAESSTRKRGRPRWRTI
jgi:hypothetical protein